jgi:hypothetical protein
MVMATQGPGAIGPTNTFVMYDPNVPVCVEISRVLNAGLWGELDGRPAKSNKLVIVADRISTARQILRSVREDGIRPALVVGWGLEELQVAALLELKIPVVDGSVLDNPEDAILALTGRWDSGRFAAEHAAAMELAQLEDHINLSAAQSNGPMDSSEV